MKIRVTLFMLLFLTVKVQAQNLFFQKLSVKDGLSHSIAYRLFQDTGGNLWISTDNGLNKYDGYSFEKFNSQNGLGIDFTFGFKKYKKGFLVAGYDQGVKIFRNNKIESFKPLQNIKYPIDFFNLNGGALISNRSYETYLYSNRGISTFFQGIQISSVITCLNGDIIGVGNNCYKFDSTICKFQKLNIKLFEDEPFLNCIVQLSNGCYIIATNDSVVMLDEKFVYKSTILIANTKGLRKCLFKDIDGNVWISTLDKGLCMLDYQGLSCVSIEKDVVCSDFLQDNCGNIWFATYGKGLWRLPFSKIRYTTVNGELVRNLVNLKTKFRDIIVPNSQVLNFDFERLSFNSKIDNTKMMEKIDGLVFSDENFNVYADLKNIYFNSKSKTYKLNLYNRIITKVLKWNENRYIVGTKLGVYVIDLKKNTIVSLPFFRSEEIVDIELVESNLAIATNSSVFLLDASNRTRKIFFSKNSKINGICVQKMKIWIACNKGLYSYHVKNGLLQNELPIRCNDIVAGTNGDIWIASINGIYLHKNNLFQLFDNHYGVDNEITKLTLIEKSNKLFALSYDKLFELNIQGILNGKKYRENPIAIESFQLDDRIVNTRALASNSLEFKSLSIKYSFPNYNNVDQLKHYFSLNNGKNLEIFGRQIQFYDLPYGNSRIMIYIKDINGFIIAKTQLSLFRPEPFYLKTLFLLLVLVMFILLMVVIVKNVIRIRLKRITINAKRDGYLMELKQKSLQNMLNPHFLNNAINSLQSFVVQNDQRTSLKYLSLFAKLMRVNLNLLESSFISLQKEIESVKLYFAFEQIRFLSVIELNIVVSNEIQIDKLLVPSFLIQPFVENAIWHGFNSDIINGWITVNIRTGSEICTIEIIDNGIGLIKSKEQKNQNTPKVSRGTRIIYERFRILNKSNIGYSISIKDRSETGESGTIVSINFPLLTDGSDENAQLL
jgi:ligand-binding sensor domain-containing protein